jgi:hypothetical protein
MKDAYNVSCPHADFYCFPVGCDNDDRMVTHVIGQRKGVSC